MPENQAADAEVVYRIRADTKDFKKDLKSSEQEAKKTGKQVAKELESSMAKAENAAESAAEGMAEAMQETSEAVADAADTAAASAEGLGEAAEDAAEPVGGLGEEAEKTRKKYRDFSAELDEINELLEKNSKNAVLTSQKKKVLAEAVEKTTKKLDDLKDKQEEVERAYKSGDLPDEEYRKFQREIAATENELSGYKKELQNVGRETKDLADKTESDLGGALDAVTGIAGKTAAAVGTAIAAAAGAGALAVGSANDLDKAMNDLVASTDITASEMERYQGVMESIYKDNYGEDFEDISDAISLVHRNLGDLSDADLKTITEDAFMLRDTFEYDIAGSTRAAKALMDNFGISGHEAMGLIAAGAQNGLDYSDELIDSISEYSVQFAKVGLDADDMFRILEKGTETGAWNLDKVGDAIKELSIRAIDGSTATAEGFDAVGLNADTMAAKFALGGEAARDAFDETIAAISGLDDPVKQNAAGVALFGTMWEDLGADAVTALADIEDGAYNTDDALGKISENKYNDLGSMFEGLARTVEMLALPIGEKLIPVLQKLFEEAIPTLENTLGPLIDQFLKLAGPIMDLAENAIEPLATDLENFVKGDVIPYLIETLLPELEAMGESLRPIFEDFKTNILPQLSDTLRILSDEIRGLVAELLPPLLQAFMALLPPVLDLAQFLIPVLADILGQLAPIISELVPVIGLLAEYLGFSLKSAVEMVMPVIQECLELIGIVADSWSEAAAGIEKITNGNWKGAWENAVAIFRNTLNLIPSIAETVLSSLVGVINATIKGINSVTATFGVEAIPIIPDIQLPRFHTGGIIDFEGQDEAAILAKDGEMVLTKAQQKRLFEIASGFDIPQPENRLPSLLMQTGTAAPPETEPVNETYHCYLVIDGETVADAVTDKVDMQQGTNIILKKRWG